MQSRIHLSRFHQSIPHFSKPLLLFHFPLLSREKLNFLSFSNTKLSSTITPLCFCSLTSSESLKYGGWDDVELGGGSVKSSESNLLRKIFVSLGIDDKRYIFVYVLGFVCALAISRVRVSSIVVVPAVVLVFAFGFSFGVVNGGHINELSLTGLKKKSKDDSYRVLIENLRYLVDLFDEFDVKIVNLKTDIKRGISSNLITVGDLEGYIKVIESIALSALNTRNVAEGVLDNLSIENQEIERNSNQKVSKKKKEKNETGFDFSNFVFGLFKGNPKTSKTKEIVKRETADFVANDRIRQNILAPAVEKQIPIFFNAATNSGRNEDSFSSINDFSDPYLVIGDEEFVERSRRTNTLDDDDNMSFMRFDSDSKSVTEDKEYSFESNDLHSLNKSRFNPAESSEYLNDLLDLDDVSFDQDQKFKKVNGNHIPLNNTEHEMLTKNRTVDFDSTPSSMVSDDIVFNGYLTEANTILKQARQYLNNKEKKRDVEKTLIRSAKLLSKAIDMKPMSLLAVGQLGNTYLLHGELKLKMSRRLRSLLARRNESLHYEIGYLIDGLDKEVGNKEKIGSVLVDVCEECEELLVKAGRQYKLALSIDSNDVRALYNWGLALSFRAQLIADIGPEAASDADKLYMAAIDKFDAMMSKSNVYAPDALFRWGLALQQRSRLRRRNIREKVKLLKQAKRLYEDAIDMDVHNNLKVKQALSSCISELNYVINY